MVRRHLIRVLPFLFLMPLCLVFSTEASLGSSGFEHVESAAEPKIGQENVCFGGAPVNVSLFKEGVAVRITRVFVDVIGQRTCFDVVTAQTVLPAIVIALIKGG